VQEATDMSQPTFSKGLDGVIAAESRICDIDGDVGRLSYRGYDIEDLAENSTFSEVAYLLLEGNLPSEAQLATFRDALRAHREVDPSLIAVLRALPRDTHPMIALQTAVAAHGALIPVAAGRNPANFERALDLIARLPTLVAAWHRIAAGLEPIAPRHDLGHGQNFLYMISGEVPNEERGRIFDVCLILHMEHSFNASTFTGRVVASTMAPLDASIAAAVGALYGPLHGGANEGALHMLADVPTVDAAEGYVLGELGAKRKIFGMGHRVYKAKDPRSFVLERYLAQVAQQHDPKQHYAKLKRIEEVMKREMEKAGKKIYPNVDFFSGALYELLGIHISLFTPIFAIARVAGWAAHILEQWEDNRIFRPECLYTGSEPRTWKPFSGR
jgi:citrate synthase